MSAYNSSRRKFIKSAAYTAPVVVTLMAAPSFAKGGSNVNGNISCHVDKHQNFKCKSTGFTNNIHMPKKENAFTHFLKSILKLFGF